MNERDEMKARAEAAPAPRKVGGLDGVGWFVFVQTHPGCTLPPGAATLLVDHVSQVIGEIYSGARELAGDFPLPLGAPPRKTVERLRLV